MADYLVSKELRVLLLKTHAVVFSVFIPLFHLDDKINGLSVLNALDTEQGLHVDDADAAKLDKMPGDVRRASHQGIVADTADLHHVIADETVASLDQLQSSLALANAALAHDQNTLAVNIHQYAMDGNTGSQLHIQTADDLCHERCGGLMCRKNRNVPLNGHPEHILIRRGLRGVDQTGHIIGKKLLVNFQPSLPA